MEYLVVSFRSRSDTIGFSNYLSSFGVSNQIENTPKEAGVGCGLSVKISLSNLKLVKVALSKFGYRSFAGIFYVKIVAGKRIVRSI